MKSLEDLATIPNVAAGAQISIKLPLGSLYEKVWVKYEGVTLAEMQNIRLEANTRIISEWPDGVMVDSINKHYNRKTKAGYLVIHFAVPELDTAQQRRFFGLDTSASQGITSAQIVMDIAGTAADPKISAFVEKSTPIAGMKNWLVKTRRQTFPVTSAGDFDIDGIQRPVGTSIAAFHLYMGDGADLDTLCDITKAQLLVNNVNWHNLSAADAATVQELYDRVPQVNDSAVIDLTLDGDISHALPINGTVQDLRIRAKAADVGTVTLMTEYVDIWGSDRF